MSAQLLAAGSEFADEQLTRVNIAQLTRLMTLDYLDGGSRADAWFADNLNPYMLPVMTGHHRRLQAISASLNAALNEHITAFEQRSRQRLIHHGLVLDETMGMQVLRQYTDPVLHSAGLRRTSAITGGSAITVAGVSIAGTGLLANAAAASIRTVIYRMLTPAVAKLAGRMTAAYSTAWIPYAGAAIAIGGTLWTGFEIYQLRGDAIEGFNEGLQAFIDDSWHQVYQDIILPVNASLNTLRDDFRPVIRQLAAHH